MPDGTAADFVIETAEREAMPVLAAFWGPSGSGKTYSALRFARGLVGPEGRIGLIDTENKRARMYARIGEPWDHLDLQPPFTPDRYRAALQAFEDKGRADGRGYDCVIVDSTSHCWQGEGGVLEMADRQTTSSGRPMLGLAKWKAPKMAFQRMQNYFLRAPFHVIFCLRAKEGVRQKGGGPNAEIEYVGLEPICEKNFIYEMTISILIGPDHKPLFEPIDRFKPPPTIPAVKAPEELAAAFPAGRFVDEDAGRAVAEWVAGGVSRAPRDAGGSGGAETDELYRVAADVATFGMTRLEQHWSGLDQAAKKALKPRLDGLKQTAREADEAAAANQDGDDLSFGEGGQSATGQTATSQTATGSDPLSDEPGPGTVATDAAGRDLDITSAG